MLSLFGSLTVLCVYFLMLIRFSKTTDKDPGQFYRIIVIIHIGYRLLVFQLCIYFSFSL